MDISEMTRAISDTGILKPNQYIVTIQFPPQIANQIDSNISEHLALRTSRVNLPSMEMNTTDYASSSIETFPIARGRAPREPISVAIVLSEDLREKQWFDTWLDNINSERTNYLTTYYDQYAEGSELNIYIHSAMTEKNENLPRYIFRNIYPTSVGEVEFSYDDRDAYAILPVTFNWESYSKK